MDKTMGSAVGLSVGQKRLILEEAVRVGVNPASRRGFPELREFSRKRLRKKIDDHVLSQLFRETTVLLVDALRQKDRDAILKVANRLNGMRNSERGIVHLRLFAARKRTLMVSSFVIDSLLKDSETTKAHTANTARCWCSGVTPQYSGYMHKVSLPA